MECLQGKWLRLLWQLQAVCVTRCLLLFLRWIHHGHVTAVFHQVLGCKMLLMFLIIIIINNNDTTTIFIVLSSRQSHCESSLGSHDEYSDSARWPPTFGPSQSAWATGPPVNRIHHRHLLSLLSPKADTHFTIPQRVEGWVDLSGCYIPRWFTHP